MTKEGNEIIFDLKEKYDELKAPMEVLFPIISQPHAYSLRHVNLGIKVDIIKQALFFNAKVRNKATYRMLPIDIC